MLPDVIAGRAAHAPVVQRQNGCFVSRGAGVRIPPGADYIVSHEGVDNTADVTCRELKAAREAAELHQYQVAYLLNVSEDTVSRWERGESFPTPDQVDKLEKLYKAPGLWYGWMRYHIKSFRDRYPENAESAALALSMVTAKYELADLQARQEDAIRDALDGRINDTRAFAAYLKEAKDAHAAIGQVLAQAEFEG